MTTELTAEQMLDRAKVVCMHLQGEDGCADTVVRHTPETLRAFLEESGVPPGYNWFWRWRFSNGNLHIYVNHYSQWDFR